MLDLGGFFKKMISIALTIWQRLLPRGSGGPNIPYDHIISDGLDDGAETYGTGWFASGAGVGRVYDPNGNLALVAGDLIVTYSFPNVQFYSPCVQAKLYLFVSNVVVPGFRIKTELADVTGLVKWSATHIPSDVLLLAPGNNSPCLTSHSIFDSSATTGPREYDVTDMVNDVINSANWSYGDRMNFIFYHAAVNAQVTLGSVDGAYLPVGTDTPARLTII